MAPESTYVPNNAYAWMDALRLIAAVEVVLYHFVHSVFVAGSASPETSLMNRATFYGSAFGQEAVMVFFVLSGFWIAKSVDRLLPSAAFWPSYLIQRMSRLMIVLVPALLIGGALDFLGGRVLASAIYINEDVAWGARPDILLHLGPKTLLANLMFLEDQMVSPYGSNYALWSLSCEFWYYLIYPALALLVLRKKPTIFLPVAGLLIAWPSLAELFPIWLLGCALYYADKHWRWRRQWSTAEAAAALAITVPVFMAALSIARFHFDSGMPGEWLTGGATAILLLVLLRSDPLVPDSIKPLARLGANSSYSIYVTHMPLGLFTAAIAVRILPAAISSSLAVHLAVVAVALVYGWLFSLFTERQTPHLREFLSRLLQQAALVKIPIPISPPR